MCSWCWAFRPAYDYIIRHLPEHIRLVRLLGGLAPDSDEPMSADMRLYIQGHWHRIQSQVPGTTFNFAFWQLCQPRRSTWPACRAVIAARQQGKDQDDRMTMAIQKAYYQDARNPSDTETLVELARELALETDRFIRDLESADTNATLLQEIRTSRDLGVPGFPALLIESGDVHVPVAIEYLQPEKMLDEISAKCEP